MRAADAARLPVSSATGIGALQLAQRISFDSLLHMFPWARKGAMWADGALRWLVHTWWLQLPLSNLGSALQQMPPAVAIKAAEFLDSPKCGPLPQQTQALVRERAAAAREAAARAAAAKEAAAREAAAADAQRPGKEAAEAGVSTESTSTVKQEGVMQ